ncbi:hypothetical protein D5086_004438 [Populus alba]|uniref:Uncharacterized protein n=1 Tax=Populus alba TaxID=43335 RepID=A0ACC4CQF4_POPAL
MRKGRRPLLGLVITHQVQFYTSDASNSYGALERIYLAWGILKADRLDYNPGGTGAGFAVNKDLSNGATDGLGLKFEKLRMPPKVRPYSIDWPSNHEYGCPFQHSVPVFGFETMGAKFPLEVGPFLLPIIEWNHIAKLKFRSWVYMTIVNSVQRLDTNGYGPGQPGRGGLKGSRYVVPIDLEPLYG